MASKSGPGSITGISIDQGDAASTRHALGVPGQNSLINGGFRVAQRGTSFIEITNGDYTLDRWYGLSDGNSVVDIVKSSTILMDGGYGSVYMSDATINKKFGLCQIIEGKDTAKLFKNGNGKCSLSFDARVTNSGFGNVKAAVLAWDGTEDAPTGNWVSTWNGNGVTPSPITNWKIENTPTNLSVGTTAARYKIENISIDTASTKNLAVFIWNDDLTTPGGEAIYLARVKLEPGEVATDYEERPYAEELALCQRYCIQWTLDAGSRFASGFCRLGTLAHVVFQFPAEMRANPTMSVSDNTHFRVEYRSSIADTTGLTLYSSDKTATVIATVADVMTLGDGCLLMADATGGRWIRADAEL